MEKIKLDDEIKKELVQHYLKNIGKFDELIKFENPQMEIEMGIQNPKKEKGKPFYTVVTLGRSAEPQQNNTQFELTMYINEKRQITKEGMKNPVNHQYIQKLLQTLFFNKIAKTPIGHGATINFEKPIIEGTDKTCAWIIYDIFETQGFHQVEIKGKKIDIYTVIFISEKELQEIKEKGTNKYLDEHLTDYFMVNE